MCALNIGGNPSSVHTLGRAARRSLDLARRRLSDLLGLPGHHVVFTGSATESNVTVLRGISYDHVLVSAADHESLREPAGPSAIELPLGADGRVSLEALATQLNTLTGKILVTLTAVNGEAGIIQPIAQVHALCAARPQTHLHIDAVQAFGKLPVAAYAPYGDTLTLAFHKIGGPRGMAVLAAREEAALPAPLLTGGGQERRRRAGTENILAAAGLAALLQPDFSEQMQQEHGRLLSLRLYTEEILADIPQAVIFGADAPRAANTVYVAAPVWQAETAVIAADLAGICISAGSACSSGKAAAGRLPAATGRSDLTGRALRLSAGHATGAEDLSAAAQLLKKLAIA